MSKKFKVLAGDFAEGDNSFSSDIFILKSKSNNKVEHIHRNKIASIDIATEETVKRLGGALKWGLAGSMMLGPAGLLAGLLLGGKGKDIIFIVKFKDGRQLLASSDSKTYTEIQAAAFDSITREKTLRQKIKQTEKKPSVPSIKNDSISEFEKLNEIEQLVKLNDMLDKGLITKEEFIEYKLKIRSSSKVDNQNTIETPKKQSESKNIEHKLSIDEVFKKIEQDGYTFISPITVKENSTENTFFVRQDTDKVQLLKHGNVIKTYTL